MKLTVDVAARRPRAREGKRTCGEWGALSWWCMARDSAKDRRIAVVKVVEWPGGFSTVAAGKRWWHDPSSVRIAGDIWLGGWLGGRCFVWGGFLLITTCWSEGGGILGRWGRWWRVWELRGVEDWLLVTGYVG